MPDSIERTLVLTVWSFSNNLHNYLWGKKNEDVVYCDPPYTGTSEKYGGFDDEAFQSWLAKCPAKQIYISEYTQLPHTEVAFNLGKKQSFTSKGKRPDELMLKYIKD